MTNQQDSLDDLRTAIEEQRRRVNELTDTVKERESSLLLAARSLYSDWQQWDGTKENFPHASLRGVIFSWFRAQRRYFIGGGIAASALAAIQVGLLWKQNEIASRQADIMMEQTRVAAEQSSFQRAQTISFIVRELRNQDPSTNGNTALISAFGDVALEVASGIVIQGPALEPKDPVSADADVNLWINAALMVGHRPNRLAREVLVTLRHKLIAQFLVLQTHAYNLAYRKSQVQFVVGAPKSASAAATYAPEDYETNSIGYIRRLDLLRDLIVSLQASIPAASSDYRLLTYDQKRELLVPIVRYYQLLDPNQTLRLPEFSMHGINYELSIICSCLNGNEQHADLQSQSIDVAKRIVESDPQLDRSFVMDALLTKWCIGLNEETSPLVQRLFSPQQEVSETEAPPEQVTPR